MDAEVLVIIVNYRTAQLTIDCLHSLAQEKKVLSTLRVTVVDNASGDDSFAKITQAINNNAWQHWITAISTDKNGGYAYGNNFAIRSTLKLDSIPDYFLLLNPDTIILPGAIKNLVDFMNKNPLVGIAGSRLEDRDGKPQHSAFRFHTFWSELESGLRLGIVSKLLDKWIVAPPISEVACQTDWVAGASMMIRREVLEKVGLLDEEYFLYYEEVDFCLQAMKAGYSCWYVPESRVIHLVGQSSGVTNTKEAPKRRPQYWFNSRQRFFLKNYGLSYTILADLLWLIGFSLWRIRRILQKKPDLDPPYFLLDFMKNSSLAKQYDAVINYLKKYSKNTNNELDLWSQIKEDWIAHQRDWTKPGFRAVIIQRFGVWRMKIEPKLIRAPFSIFYRALYRFVRNVYGIDLPYTVQLGRRVIIEHSSGIIIHGNSVIGDDCIIRQGVTLGNRYLQHPLAAPKLGKRVNIGAGAKILGDVIIGNDVNIGANAVVLSNIPDGSTVVGIPAKIVDSRQQGTGNSKCV